jgi:hypothetical protein
MALLASLASLARFARSLRSLRSARPPFGRPMSLPSVALPVCYELGVLYCDSVFIIIRYAVKGLAHNAPALVLAPLLHVVRPHTGQGLTFFAGVPHHGFDSFSNSVSSWRVPRTPCPCALYPSASAFRPSKYCS